MPNLKPYHIFISHAWKYGDEYERLVSLLSNASNFLYSNFSAPIDKPLQNLDSTDVSTVAQINEAIIRKIKPCNCVLVISGMYYNHRRWMKYELDVAKKLNKPIIAIVPRGAEKTPLDVYAVANELVSWNTDSIVSAIRRWSI